MRLRGVVTALLLGLALAAGARALEPEEAMPDPALEARARGLYAELRCVVCQNNSLLDSPSQIAADMRAVVRDRLLAGDDDAGVRQYLVDRYGDYVLLEPRLDAGTAVLWVAPGLVIVLAGGALLWRARRRPVRDEPDPLTAEERAAVDALIAESRAASSPAGRD